MSQKTSGNDVQPSILSNRHEQDNRLQVIEEQNLLGLRRRTPFRSKSANPGPFADGKVSAHSSPVLGSPFSLSQSLPSTHSLGRSSTLSRGRSLSRRTATSAAGPVQLDQAHRVGLDQPVDTTRLPHVPQIASNRRELSAVDPNGSVTNMSPVSQGNGHSNGNGTSVGNGQSNCGDRDTSETHHRHFQRISSPLHLLPVTYELGGTDTPEPREPNTSPGSGPSQHGVRLHLLQWTVYRRTRSWQLH